MQGRLTAIVALAFLLPPVIGSAFGGRPGTAAWAVLAAGVLIACMFAFRRHERATTLAEIEHSLNVKRECTAFGLAPLAVPVVGGLYFAATFWAAGHPAEVVNPIIVVALWAMALIGYVVTIAFGPPLYRFLLAHGITAFWIAPVTGFLVGCMIVYLAYVMAKLATSGSTYSGGASSADTAFTLLCGVCGAAVGTFVWLIARPDRQTLR